MARIGLRLRERSRTSVVLAATLWLGGASVSFGCREQGPTPGASSLSPVPATEKTLPPPGAADGRPFAPLLPALPAAAPATDAALRWLVLSGGADPYSTELQIETDALAAIGFLDAAYPAAGLVLFGGGASTYGIHELAADDAGGEIPLIEVIGEIFGGRGRPVSYRMNRVPAHGPADADAFVESLDRASKTSGGQLIVWLSGHGEPATGPDDAAHVVWGGDFISPQMISEATTDTRRDVLVVAAMCHAGGFTSIGMGLAPAGDEPGGARCVLAATTWDRVASGCDPDPQRQERESYARHMIEGLTGTARDGAVVPIAPRDSDGDAKVSWLEAHVYAAVVSRGFDVPISTSMRWAIAEGAKSDGLEPANAATAANAASWPEIEAGLTRLAGRLGLDPASDMGATVDQKITSLKGKIDEARVASDEAAAEESVALARLRGAILARWAVLDDPWHPAFHPTLRAHKDAIAAFLVEGERYASWQHAADRVAGLDAAASELEVAIAPWLRMKLFLDASAGGKTLMHRAPEDPARRHLEALLRCERGIPGAPTPVSNP